MRGLLPCRPDSGAPGESLPDWNIRPVPGKIAVNPGVPHHLGPLLLFRGYHSARMFGREETTFDAGTLAGAGTFHCEECGFAVALHERDEVPGCPHCGGTEFKRSSIFGELNAVQEPIPDQDE